MYTMNNRFFTSVLSFIIALSLLFSACTPNRATPMGATPSSTSKPTGTVIPTKIQTPTATPVPLPQLTLRKGDSYFTIDGRQSFLFSRNLAGYEPSQYKRLLDLTKTGGSKLVRIQLDSMGTGMTGNGQIDEAWAKKWEEVFDKAAANGILVLPVFSGWFDWNDQLTPDWFPWGDNTFNAAKGGPAAIPAELFQADSPTQKLWLQWMKALVERWQSRENIAAWEIFSEVNIASGSTESTGVAFMERAAALIREADPRHRPITASLADVGEWPSFYRSDALDFINIHPYPYDVRLDLGSKVVTDIHKMLRKYNKPVMIGESGLNQFLPNDREKGSGMLPNANLGIKHAIWAELASGAMNSRSLYWEDSFAIFFPTLDWDYLEKYAELEGPAVNFTKEVDFANFQPLTVHLPAGTKIWGAAVGNEKMVIGWFRDVGCEPPKWPLQPVISGQTVSITVPGSASEWKIDFYDTKTGTDITSSMTTIRQGDSLIVLLPDFIDDIAFKMYSQ